MASLADLIAALDQRGVGASTTTSVRQDPGLRAAVAIAVELGLASNVNDATNRALRSSLEAFAQRLALDEHYAAYPETQPGLAEVARALAVMDRSPVADRPDLLEQAANEVLAHKHGADGEDVLLWAASLLAHEDRPLPRAGSRSSP